MAIRTSATSGDYGTGATWVGGVAPVEGDSVVIACTGTAAETFSTDATGYATGATAITLTGAVAAGSYVIGESVQFGTDPNYYTITNWVSGTKVLTVTALIVAIPAVATLVKNKGHVVTIAGTYIAGDDTTSAFTVNGTLRASRVANSSLTVKGRILTATTISATIDYGRLSLSDVIPAAYTATLILNYSAAMATVKYGINIQNLSNAFFCGSAKTTNALLTNSISVGGTTCDVNDATGWLVGDYVVLPATDGNANHYERVQIATLTPGAGTTATITFAATTYAHASGADIGNLTKNVVLKNYNTATAAYFTSNHQSTAVNNRRELSNVEFQYVGSTTSIPFILGSTSGGSVLCNPLAYFQDCTFYNGNLAGLSVSHSRFISTFSPTKLLFLNTLGTNAPHLYLISGASVGLTDSCFHGTVVNSGSITSYGDGGQGANFDNIRFYTGISFVSSSGTDNTFTNCKFHSSSSLIGVQQGSCSFYNCSFGSSDLPGSPSFANLNAVGASTISQQVFNCYLENCKIGTPTTAMLSNAALANPKSRMIIANKNIDPLQQEIYTPQGTIVRDNNSIVSGGASLLMTPSSSTNALTFSLDIPALNGKLVGINGLLRRITTANVVTVTLSGLGITPSVYTASGSLATNETFFVSGTNTTGSDGILTLTISIIGTTGALYVDRISAPQAAAIDFGEFDYWTRGLPVGLITASFVSAGDVWNYLTSNINVSGSIGMIAKRLLTVAKFLGLK